MVKTLQERKDELEIELINRYLNKSSKWYNVFNRFSYHSTRSYADESNISEYEETTMVYKNKFKRHILILIFTLPLFCFIIFEYVNTDEKKTLIYGVLVFSFMLIYSLYEALKKEIYITISKEGIEINPNKIIEWDNLIISYIKKFNYQRRKSDELVIHYYDKKSDSFLQTQFDLNSILFEENDLCFYIEYWRIKTKNELQKTKEQPN